MSMGDEPLNDHSVRAQKYAKVYRHLLGASHASLTVVSTLRALLSS